jgi:hypothetical protein
MGVGMNKRTSMLVASLVILLLASIATLPGNDRSAYVYKWKRLGWIPKSLISGYSYGHYTVAYDEERNVCVLFDGYNTYTWDGTNVKSLGRIGPGKYDANGEIPSDTRMNAAIAYIEHTGKIVLFGGDVGGTVGTWCISDTWEWDGIQWKYSPISGPRALAGHMIVYDQSRKEAILFGGYINTGSMENPFGYNGNTWSYDGTGWQRIATSGPAGREAFGMTYDSDRHVIVLHGGRREYRVLRDTWEWDGMSWTKRNTIGPLRAGHSLTYDPILKKCILFGGYSSNISDITTRFESTTWTWDGSRWERLEVKTRPPARHSHGAVYFPPKQGVVIFGGEYKPKKHPLENRSIWLLTYHPVEKPSEPSRRQ